MEVLDLEVPFEIPSTLFLLNNYNRESVPVSHYIVVDYKRIEVEDLGPHERL